MRTPEYVLINNTPDQRRLIYHVDSYAGAFLLFLSRNIRDFSSHGSDHTLNIIENLNNFVKNWEIELTQDEALLLYLAAWLHDIGCIKDRDTHHEISASLLLGNKNLVETITEKNAICLKYIILAHRSRYPIKTVPKTHENIRLRMICAIFRLMDACEICYPKCPMAVYEVIKDSLDKTSQNVWIGHNNIVGLKFIKPEILIFVNELEKCQFILDDLNKEINTIRDIFKENGIAVPNIHTI